MSFRVVIARKAAREIEEHFEWIARRSVLRAKGWRDDLLQAISSLEDNPERCPETPEAEYHEDLRQLLHGKRPSVFRVLFEVQGATVVVLRVRHAAQNLLTSDEN